MGTHDKRITVSADGPYLVRGAVPLSRATIVVNDAGESVSWDEEPPFDARDTYALCRCGHSSTKPYCDGSHVDMNFDGTETAGHHSYAEQAVDIDGPGVRLKDVRHLCAEARFCDRAGGLWNLVRECDDPEKRRLAEEEAMLCPSGRYVLCNVDGTEHEPVHEPSIVLTKDPAMGCSGPLWVRGGVPVIDAAGEPYEVRNRVTLCRCGRSQNKPFCDGSHITEKFSDHF